jgi:excisionase family DNA binding protein
MSAPLLTKDDVAARLNIHPRSVLKFAARGELASIRVGRVVRFEAAALDAFIDAHRSYVVPVRIPPTPPVPQTLPAPSRDRFA